MANTSQYAGRKRSSSSALSPRQANKNKNRFTSLTDPDINDDNIEEVNVDLEEV